MAVDNDWPHDSDDGDYEPEHEDWVPLEEVQWMVLHWFQDGDVEILRVKRRPDGGFTIEL